MLHDTPSLSRISQALIPSHVLAILMRTWDLSTPDREPQIQQCRFEKMKPRNCAGTTTRGQGNNEPKGLSDVAIR